MDKETQKIGGISIIGEIDILTSKEQAVAQFMSYVPIARRAGITKLHCFANKSETPSNIIIWIEASEREAYDKCLKDSQEMFYIADTITETLSIDDFNARCKSVEDAFRPTGHNVCIRNAKNGYEIIVKAKTREEYDLWMQIPDDREPTE